MMNAGPVSSVLCASRERPLIFPFSSSRNLIIEEKSFVPCEDLKYGRISFKGFNPEVEVCFNVFIGRTKRLPCCHPALMLELWYAVISYTDQTEH